MAYTNNRQIDLEKRKILRKELSPYESLLWAKLRKRNLLGIKFRRQYGVGSYVVDFYSPSLNLAIEIDGDSHYWVGAESYDMQRQRYIEALGNTVLRFTNTEVKENLEEVIERITEFCIKITSPRPSLDKEGNKAVYTSDKEGD